MEFVKLQGCGNHFVVLHDSVVRIRDWTLTSRKILDPNFGVGGDGLMLIKPVRDNTFVVDMFNPDGSVMGMCGNGIRCVVRYLVMKKMVADSCSEIRFDVHGKKILCTFTDEGRMVRVDMGVPSFTPRDLPVNADTEVVLAPFSCDLYSGKITAVSMGNPHCVIFVDSFDGLDLSRVGSSIENHPFFPKRTNVEFVRVLSSERLQVKVWERGAGATLACGTGACASLVAASRAGFSGRHATIELPGGSLDVRWDDKTGVVYMTGPADELFFGTISSSLISEWI